MSEIDILKRFSESLISFLDELICQFPAEGDLVVFRIFVKDMIQSVDIMNYFIVKILPFKGMVVSRDEDFFLNHCTLFDSLQDNKKSDSVIHFKKLWRSASLDKDDKNVIWAWFDSFILLAEKYQKCFSAKIKIKIKT